MRSLLRLVACALVLTLIAPVAASAQTEATPTPPVVPRTGEKDPSDLPVSLARIRRELMATARPTDSKDKLNIHYYVEVYGRAPRIELFTPADNLANSPVMYGGMTHQEFLNVITPEEFRAPAAGFNDALAALIKWLSDKKAKNKTPSGEDVKK